MIEYMINETEDKQLIERMRENARVLESNRGVELAARMEMHRQMSDSPLAANEHPAGSGGIWLLIALFAVFLFVFILPKL